MRQEQISYNLPRARDALFDPVISFGNISNIKVSTPVEIQNTSINTINLLAPPRHPPICLTLQMEPRNVSRWAVQASALTLSVNPIRVIVDNLVGKECPSKELISLAQVQ
jgi:hypothetical protein